MKFLVLFIICIQFCMGTNFKEKSTQLIELKVIKGSDFEHMKMYGGKFYLSAYHGSKEDTLDLLSVRNKRINLTDVKKEITGFETKNLLYIELITSKNIDSNVMKHSFQNEQGLIKNFRLFHEKVFLINNRTIEYQSEEFKEPPLLFGKGFIPISRRIYKSEELYCYIFLLPVEKMDRFKMWMQSENSIEFLP